MDTKPVYHENIKTYNNNANIRLSHYVSNYELTSKPKKQT